MKNEVTEWITIYMVDTYRQGKTMGAAIFDSKASLSWSFFEARLSNGK